MDVALDIGIYAGIASFFGLALLLPLYFSQARDIHRLRTWMALTPDLRVAELEAVEAARVAEAELAERIPAVPPPGYEEPRTVPGLAPPAPPLRPAPGAEPAPGSRPLPGVPPPPGVTPIPGLTPAPGTTPVRPLTPAERIALDRPATARLTAERTAVHPRVVPRGVPARVEERTTGRNLALAVGAVLALGIAVVFVSLQLSDEGERRQAKSRPSAVVPSEVEAAVLNGTAEPGLAGKVADDLEANEFVVGAVTNSQTPFDQTVVMFTPGSQREAQAVANALGAVRVQPIDAETRAVAGDSSVAVIAGEDRVGG
jgi:hypothetical protein